MDLSMTGGPWNRSKVGVHGVLAHVFFIWIQSNHRIEFSNLSFPIAHFPAGRLTCANSGENFVADPPFCGFMNGGRQNFPTKVGTFHTILHPPYQAPAGPRPTISGPDLPYQAPCILSWVSGNSRIFGFCFFKSNSRFHKRDWLTILLDG